MIKHYLLNTAPIEQGFQTEVLGLSNPGIEPRSPTLLADSLPSEPPGKPNPGTALQGIYREKLGILLTCKGKKNLHP